MSERINDKKWNTPKMNCFLLDATINEHNCCRLSALAAKCKSADVEGVGGSGRVAFDLLVAVAVAGQLLAVDVHRHRRRRRIRQNLEFRQL